ncbi:FtsW/RodA/SpoVE family cell cycle protein [Patescibacteria group bacterium]
MRYKYKHRPHTNNLFIITLVLVFLGLVSVANVSAPNAITLHADKFYFAKQHIIWATVGIGALIGVSMISTSLWKKLTVPLFFASIILLVLVLVPSVGSEIFGARRWIVIGGFSIQPSEISKLALVLFVAKVASSKKGYLSYFLPIGITSFLIILQPDLGTTLLIVAIGMSQVFISGVNPIYVGAMSFLGGLLATFFVIFSDYRKQRLLTFLHQTSDPLGEGYHIRQILIALASGGIFGVGLGQSRQKYLFLPEVCTDSVFAIIAEEVGFVGAMLILFLLLLYLYQGIKIAWSADDVFDKVLSVGLLTWIGGQMFLNIGSMVALIPLTGIPLPFFSCGGSSLVMILIATGILLSISKNAKAKKRKK